MITITGRLSDPAGISQHLDVTSAIGPGNQLIAHGERVYVSLPVHHYLTRQPSPIALDLHHRKVCGEVRYIQRSNDTGLVIVATAEDVDELADLDIEMFLSPALRYRIERQDGGSVQAGTDVVIDSVALCTDPATIGQVPIKAIPGDLRAAHSFAACRRELRHAAELIARCQRYERNRNRSDDHIIIDLDAVNTNDTYETYERDYRGPSGPMRYSGARGKVLSVH